MFSPGPGRHLILGGNGAGKTSLLEAIYTVSTTKSFRTPRLSECVAHGAESFALRAEAIDPSGARATLALAWDHGGRARSVNSSETDLAEHLAVLPVVAWDSNHVEILSGGPRLRRRLLDRSVVGRRPAAIDLLVRYRRALAQKREVLAQAGRRGRDVRGSLHAWNEVLAGAAADVIAARAEAARRLAASLETVLASIDLPLPPIHLAYRPSPACGAGGVGAIAERFAELADRELRRGVPVSGPHRDELEVTWDGHPVAQVASAGERKTLSLALALAQGRELEEAGRPPVYLLDDLDAELAVPTLTAVWRALGDSSQLFASSNRPAAWDALGVDFRWSMEGGVLEAWPEPSESGSSP